ncbi:unnamed protein product [Prorocentrum cordatum]|uniref:Uncharacterized protein n=1 Tax=Prorocentrum cordatum TaxID=2364126 RepID=A0ABN9Q9F3_9DINO|nr:unnamed protein product [Polarella glacialis]
MTACLGRLALIPPRGGRGEKDGGGYEGNEDEDEDKGTRVRTMKKGGGGGGASKRAAIAKSPRDKCQRPPSRVPEERPMLSAVAPVAQLRHGRRLAAAQARRPRNGQAATPNSTQQNAEKNEVSGTNNIRFVPWQGKEGAE